MKSYWLRSLSFLFVLVVYNVSAIAADNSPQRFTSRVKITVGSSDKIKDSVRSYLNRELRSLNDVELVDTDPEWEIDVIAMELKTTSGRTPGVVLSIVIGLYYDKAEMANIIKPLYADSFLQKPNGLQVAYWHLLQVDSADNLQKMCKEFIATFDSQYLETGRKSNRQAKESLQKSK